VSGLARNYVSTCKPRGILQYNIHKRANSRHYIFHIPMLTFFVVSCTPDQIHLLSALKSFEVDMSYKRIRAKDLNEVLFATFLALIQKSLENWFFLTATPKLNPQ
jgi:hypothetical protein